MKVQILFFWLATISFTTLNGQGDVTIDGIIQLIKPFSSITFFDNDSVQKALISFDSYALRLDNDLDSSDVIISSEQNISLATNGFVRMITDETGNTIFGGSSTEGKVGIWADSGLNSPTLELREIADDYARIYFRSQPDADDKYFMINANPGTADDPELNIYYRKNLVLGYNLISVDGDDRLVGIHKSNPEAHLHVKQRTAGEEALALENDTDGDKWSFEVASDDLLLYFNGTLVGTFDNATGSYSPSDRRLKNSIQSIPDGTLNRILKLKPSSYYYNHITNPERRELGFVAQEVESIFPEIVVNAEDSDFLVLKYHDFIPLLTKAIQEQHVLIRNLENRIKAVENIRD